MEGSVRSLPPRRMNDIRSMFENQSAGTCTPVQQEETKSYVRSTQSKFEEKDVMADSPTPRWRQHISSSEQEKDRKSSPVRKHRQNFSPSQPDESSSGFPTPSPRGSLNKHVSFEVSPEHGLSGLHVAKFTGIATAVADAGEVSTPNRVSRLIGQMEANSCEVTSNSAVDKIRDPSPNKISLMVPSLAYRHTQSPEKSNELSEDSNETKVCTSHFKRKENSADADLSSDLDEKRPVSVFQRSKLFENISGTPSTHLQKPAKPPPPTRKKSFNEGSSTANKMASEKIPPKRPPMRQRSLVERQNKSETELEVNAAEETDLSSCKIPMKPPMPPSKPRRTYAHDDYIKVKLEKEGENEMTKSANADLGQELGELESSTETVTVKVPAEDTKRKPLRPPPPQKKQRPFSIAGDTMEFRSSDESDSDASKGSTSGTPFYEVIPLRKPASHDKGDLIKHWDLPRMSHPEPIRRSLSDDCIHKAVDNEVARTCNIIFIVLDVLKPLQHKRLIEHELEGFGIRLNKEPPNIGFKRKEKGGLNLTATVAQSELDQDLVKTILSEYKIHNADINLRGDYTSEDLIDVVEGNRIYIPAIYLLNKIDQISIEELDIIYKIPHCVPISAHHKWNFDDLLEKMWEYLRLVRIYTKPKGQLPDYSSPIVLKEGKCTVEDFCNKIHRSILKEFKNAIVWGSSVKYQPQKVGKDHQLCDEDVVQIIKKN